MPESTLQPEYSCLTHAVTTLRRWRCALFTLQGLLASSVLCWVCLALYVHLDHRFHFSPLLRAGSLVILALAIAFVALRTIRHLHRRNTLLAVAAYADRRLNLDQQLLTAVECAQAPPAPPHSLVLTHLLGQRLGLQVAPRDITRLAPRVAVIVCILALLALLAPLYLVQRDHQSAAVTYLNRLARPTAPIAPLPATVIHSLTTNVTVAPHQPFTLAAAFTGRLPDHAVLVIDPSAADPCTPQRRRILPAQPIDAQTVEVSHAAIIRRVGLHRYRFEVDGLGGPWHEIAVGVKPTITYLQAAVTAPNNLPTQWHQIRLEDPQLSAPAGSDVELHLEINTPLENIQALLPQGSQVPGDIEGTAGVLTFSAQQAGFVILQGCPIADPDERLSLLNLQLHLADGSATALTVVPNLSDHARQTAAAVSIRTTPSTTTMRPRPLRPTPLRPSRHQPSRTAAAATQRSQFNNTPDVVNLDDPPPSSDQREPTVTPKTFIVPEPAAIQENFYRNAARYSAP